MLTLNECEGEASLESAFTSELPGIPRSTNKLVFMSKW
jgi:hypothetical protein